MDSPAGLGAGFRLAVCDADRAIVVAVSDPSSCGMPSGWSASCPIWRPSTWWSTGSAPAAAPAGATIDDAMDTAGLPLLGLVPEDAKGCWPPAAGRPLAQMSQRGAAKAYENIARRLTGQQVPLMRIRC